MRIKLIELACIPNKIVQINGDHARIKILEIYYDLKKLCPENKFYMQEFEIQEKNRKSIYNYAGYRLFRNMDDDETYKDFVYLDDLSDLHELEKEVQNESDPYL